MVLFTFINCAGFFIGVVISIIGLIIYGVYKLVERIMFMRWWKGK